MEALQTGLGAVPLALFMNRIVLGLFFAISGYHKLFNKTRHATLVSTLRSDGIPLVTINQWFVPACELLFGTALLFAIYAPIAAAVLLVICIVATCVDGCKRVEDWDPLDAADRVDDYLYLPEVLYALGLVMVIMAGPGSLWR